MKLFGYEIKRFKEKNSIKTNYLALSKSNPDKQTKSIIDKIIKTFQDRSRKDIQKWRKALLMAEHPEKPRRYLLQDIYKDLGTDGHLKSLIRLRKYATINTAFNIIGKDGNINREATDFFNKKWFYKLLNLALDSIFYGYTLIEFERFLEDNIQLALVNRRNVIPELRQIIPDLTRDETISYDDPYYDNWLLEVGEREDLGILNDIIPNLIWKRNVGQSWAEFTEKFGIPMITASISSYNQKDIDKVDYMLANLAEASRGIFPEGTNIEFKESNRTDAYQSYEHFIKYNKDEISVAIIGGTMITHDGSSRSQSEVHERNLDKKIAIADKRELAFLINDKLIPILINHGYNFIEEGDKFTWSESHGLSLKDYWSIATGIMKDYEVDEKWISDTFFIPIKGKKKRPSLVNNQITVNNVKFPDYPKNDCPKCDDSYHASGGSKYVTLLNDLHKLLMKALWAGKETKKILASIIALESYWLATGLFKGWGKRRIKAGWNEPDHLMLSLMEMNLFEFSASKTEARLATMTQLLIDKEKHQIRSFEEFKKLAEQHTKNFNEHWLRTEYNLSVATGQNSAAYARFISEKDTVTSFVQYQTAGDERVRTSHQLLDGKIFNLSDKEAMRLWPPNGYGCRCEMIQYVGDTAGKVSKGKDFTGRMPEGWKKGFDFNRGDLKQVFAKKQFYSKEKGIIKKISQMTYEDYGLKSISELSKGKPELNLDKTITGKNVHELFKVSGKKDGEEYMEFTDYIRRTVGLFKQTFDTHTKGKYLNESEQRHRLFPFVKDALNSPDEVWLTESNIKDKYQIRYIKFFKNNVLIVDTVRNSVNGVELKTWYLLKVKENIIRKGLLLINKPF